MLMGPLSWWQGPCRWSRRDYGYWIDNSDSDTIGGYVFGLLERTPIVGDTVDAHGYTFEVTQMQGYRISRIKVTPLPVEEATEEENEEA